jgi:amidase
MNDPDPSTYDLSYLSAGDVIDALEAGSLTSAQLVENCLDRIAALDVASSSTALNSIAALNEHAGVIARERDEERKAGVLRGPLHGVPVVIKDNIEATEFPTLAGSTALRGRPTRDAELVTRLRDAGAILLASTNLSQWANIRSPRSTSGYCASAGLVGNPWALDRSAGGSSSGSGAAVAAGLSPLDVGTETDGSIVCPASLNGVVGLKPTVGAVPSTYVVPISSSQDSVGPMARSVDDVALLYRVLANQTPPASIDTPSFCVATNWRTGDRETDALFDEVMNSLRTSGMTVVDRELAIPGEQEQNDESLVLFSELYDDLSSYLAGRPGDGVRSLEDVIHYEDENFEIEQRYFGHENFIAAVESGGRRGPNYAGARERNLAWARDTCLLPGLEGVDVVVAPAFGPSWKSDLPVGAHPGAASCVTMASAITGWPILCMPLGLVHNLPVGVALCARANSEWALLRAARLLELVIGSRGPWPSPAWRAPSRG